MMSSNTVQIVIYGAGGHGREVAWLVEECNMGTELRYEIACFADDDTGNQGKFVNGVPVFSLAAAYERYPSACVVGGVGHPQTRERLMSKAQDIGFGFTTIIHPRVERSRWITFGQGVMICAGTIMTTNIVLGSHVQINRSCNVGHDVVMDDYATLAPGANISGTVHIGKRAYIGAGAVIINGRPDAPITVGDDAVVGAGACVTKSVGARTTVAGVPARLLQNKD